MGETLSKDFTILFDLDGTLIDSTEAVYEGFCYAYSRFGLTPPPLESVSKLIGHPLDVMFAELGIAHEVVWDFVDTYKEKYREISNKKTTFLNGALEAIELAHSFATLGIVTTKTGRYSKLLLEHFGILDKFGCVIGREDVEKPKPDKEPMIKAVIALSTSSKNTFMIGDTCMDMIAARRANLKGIGVTCGYGDKESLQNCTDVIFSSALEAVKYIKSIHSS